ncbi:hypothetical protein INT45_004718 [Circinella minor]|uniref:Uncharacterized protein n=1 Tax=Circinella minor TaxID=1195481 RepID=A0A8H7VM25_9FUNG|nr:hypothetical protein INT45_004718 [Circinella minor]
MTDLEATVYVLYLGSNGLYIINEVTTISLPRTLFEVKEGGILRVVSSLNIVKKNDETTITSSQTNTTQNEADCKAWTRTTWFPPKYESDSDDD